MVTVRHVATAVGWRSFLKNAVGGALLGAVLYYTDAPGKMTYSWEEVVGGASLSVIFAFGRELGVYQGWRTPGRRH
jgi:hypothetical protein